MQRIKLFSMIIFSCIQLFLTQIIPVQWWNQTLFNQTPCAEKSCITSGVMLQENVLTSNGSTSYHLFRWYVTLENKTPAETFPKFPSILCVIDMSNRNPPITAC